jgi:predicted RNA-binding Zn-ribbon protein involved in translation (DUF1610 family)
MASAGSAGNVEAGRVVGAGTYRCRACGIRIALDSLGEVPACPACGCSELRRAPLFSRAGIVDPPPTDEIAVELQAHELPGWLPDARRALADGERYLVFEESDTIRVVPLPIGWARIGRSMTSDIRIDDPTVSRRHALVVRSAGGTVRVLDDRSTNGVALNGSRVEWGTLADGDELAIGRFRLYLVALDPAGSRSAAPALAAD